MPSLSQIRAAYRTGIAANTAQAALLRDLRRPFREAGVDDISDLAEALRYVHATSAAAIGLDQGKWFQAWSLILPALSGMPWDGARQVRDTRNRVRTLMVDAGSPDWLKDHCQRLKRTQKLDQNQAGERVYDRQPTDPIEALADAAAVTIAAANSTAEQLVAATQTLELFRELTPE